MNKETLENSKQGLPQLGTKEFNDLASAYFGGKSKQEATLEQIDQTNPVTRGSTALVYKEETLEEAAQRLYPIELEDDGWDKNKQYRDEWIEGAKWQQEQFKNESTANYIDRHIVEALVETAKQERMYSEEEVEKQKLQFAIEQLNKLDSVLQSKYEILSNMQQEFLGKRKEEQLASKKSGLRLAKEEIRRDIKELEQKLSEL